MWRAGHLNQSELEPTQIRLKLEMREFSPQMLVEQWNQLKFGIELAPISSIERVHKNPYSRGEFFPSTCDVWRLSKIWEKSLGSVISFPTPTNNSELFGKHV